MKTAVIKNSLYYFFILLLLGCNNTFKKDISYVIDVERDSVFYNLDIKDDFKKEKLLVTRKIIVADSIIGAENEDNIWKKVDNYCSKLKKEKGEDFYCPHKYLYSVFIEEANSYTKIISYKLDMDNIAILRQGITNIQFDNRPQRLKNDMQYLRITILRAEDMNVKSINIYFEEKSNQWKIFSLERIGVDYFNEEKKIKYCIDTTTYFIEDYIYENFEWLGMSRSENCLQK